VPLEAAARPRALPPVAAQVDAELARLDARLDWLLALSPVGSDALWTAFDASGRTEVPPLRYIDLETDLDEAREQLHALPVSAIESPLLSELLIEKQRELGRMVDLVRLRGTDGFVAASIELFGGVEPELRTLADHILASVGTGDPLVADTGIDVVLSAVESELAWYRDQDPDFRVAVVADTDIDSLMMVSHGTFYIDANIRLPRARLQPLIQHEIGTHVVTRHNGRRQALRQLEVGLAQYDPLQEGLGVLAEYLAGYLPGERLRVLAARVVAVDMAIHGQGIPAIFDVLHNEHALPTDDAFDVAVRALRGGGLTKDAVYLRGLRDLLVHLHQGGGFEPLFAGKFALSHLDLLDQLLAAGWVVPPQLLPRYCLAPGFDAALARCRATPVERLFHPHHNHQEQAG
jgi:uncharacterized protein (TIGR02421 family)